MIPTRKEDNGGRHGFPLTSLQIGDLQSYRSDLNLFLALKSKKFYILVDNRPWLRNPGPLPAHLWQLMVTKSRLSPFANTKKRRVVKERKVLPSKPDAVEAKKIQKWFSMIDAATLTHTRVPVNKLKSKLLLTNELHLTLYGYIVFEVAWPNVRGMSYLNELQTHTSMAIEAKFMRRWEFESIDQAAKSLSSWFTGTESERSCLKEYLDIVTGDVFYDAEKEFPRIIPTEEDNNCCNDNISAENDFPHDLGRIIGDYPATTEDEKSEPHTPPPTGPYKRRRVTKVFSTGGEMDVYMEETQNGVEDSSENIEVDSMDNDKEAAEPTQYKDILIVFRFDDPDLPFELRKIIMSDLRLLTLLEAGLPSWVIFLQSYPFVCHLYRPWMCILARTLYVLVSLVTVIIGFYDLYKNVPVLKSTASHLCGPLFDWVETWDMVSRIRYLGTMLFLHNFQKAVRLSVTMTSAVRSFFSFLTIPLAQPFMEVVEFIFPLWNILTEVGESVLSAIWIVVGSSYDLVEDIVQFIFLPISFIISLISQIGTSVFGPMFWILWKFLYIPLRGVLKLASCFSYVSSYISKVLTDVWRSASGIIRFASSSKAAVSTSEVSMWRSLSKDLFSQVFRALRSILNVFADFFAACNRHRLSIYNHIHDFLMRLSDRTTRSGSQDPIHSKSEKEKPH